MKVADKLSSKHMKRKKNQATRQHCSENKQGSQGRKVDKKEKSCNTTDNIMQYRKNTTKQNGP